jgi:UDP-N-acetylglucosamine 2-epimerase (non-hydrolysing)
MKIDIIAGARPNFIKIAPIIHEINRVIKLGESISFRLIHTGQHYDRNMSGSFFEELNIPDPDVNLNAGGGTQAEQTAAIMIGYEQILTKELSDLCLVVGDVTSTMACSIVAKKMGVKVAHVEGGLRSFDLSMPEEINRMVTDSISDYFFTTSEVANVNLKNIGIKEKQIFFVGNTMIDTLLSNMHRLKKPTCFDKFNLKTGNYIVTTLHRPGNVDEELKLKGYIDSMVIASNGIPIIFPVHQEQNQRKLGLKAIYIVGPLFRV